MVLTLWQLCSCQCVQCLVSNSQFVVDTCQSSCSILHSAMWCSEVLIGLTVDASCRWQNSPSVWFKLCSEQFLVFSSIYTPMLSCVLSNCVLTALCKDVQCTFSVYFDCLYFLLFGFFNVPNILCSEFLWQVLLTIRTVHLKCIEHAAQMKLAEKEQKNHSPSPQDSSKEGEGERKHYSFK